MAADIIARGMAATAIRPGEDGKIPASYLPSYVDDVVDLIAIDETAPAVCEEGDKYYNSVDKLIYTATGTNTWGSSGEAPLQGKIYINMAQQPSTSYRWDGNNLVLIGGAGQIIQYNEMPTPESNILGKIIQYTGENDGNYVKGYYYICVSDGNDPATYSWSNIGVQGCENFMSIDADGCWNITNVKPGVYFYPKAEVSGQTTPEGFPAFSIQVEEVKLANLISAENGVRIFKSPLEAETGDIVLETYYHEGPCIKRLTLAKTANSWAETYNNILVYVDSGSDQSIAGTKTFNALPQSSAVPYLDNHLVNKKFVDDNFLGTKVMMPAASANYLNKIVEYVGDTNANYTHGYFYECISDGEDPVTYSWENINVQEGSTIQYTVMPEPTEELLGTVVQYVGEDNGDYVKNWFYECGYYDGIASVESVTGDIEATVDSSTFNNYVFYNIGTYTFTYNGSSNRWVIDTNRVKSGVLYQSGLTVTGTPVDGDTIVVKNIANYNWLPVPGLSEGAIEFKELNPDLNDDFIRNKIVKAINIIIAHNKKYNRYNQGGERCHTGIYIYADGYKEIVGMTFSSVPSPTSHRCLINLIFSSEVFANVMPQYNTHYGLKYEMIGSATQAAVYIDGEEYQNGYITDVYSNTSNVNYYGRLSFTNTARNITFSNTGYDGLPLGTLNDDAYTPTASYHPATKKYVDGIFNNSKTVKDLYLIDSQGTISDTNTLEEGDSYTYSITSSSGQSNSYLQYTFTEPLNLTLNSHIIIDSAMKINVSATWVNFFFYIYRGNQWILTGDNKGQPNSECVVSGSIAEKQIYITNLQTNSAVSNLLNADGTITIQAGDVLRISENKRINPANGFILTFISSYDMPCNIKIQYGAIGASSVIDTINNETKTQHEWNSIFANSSLAFDLLPETSFNEPFDLLTAKQGSYVSAGGAIGASSYFSYGDDLKFSSSNVIDLLILNDFEKAQIGEIFAIVRGQTNTYIQYNVVSKTANGASVASRTGINVPSTYYVDTIKSNFAADWTPISYNPGDYVIGANGQLYKCIIKTTAGHSFNINEWTLVKVTDILKTIQEETVKINEGVFRLTQSSSMADILAAFGGETDLNTLIDKLNNGARAYVSYDATVENPRVYTVDCSSNVRDERVDGSGTVILAFEYNTGERIVGGAYTFTFTDSLVTNAIATVTAIDCVTTETNQTISGKKTFTTLPESSIAPTSDNQLVNKKYVDDNAGGGGFDVSQLGFDAFSDQSTYAVGDFVTYNNKVYKCTTAVTTAGAWDAANWTESSMKGYVDSIVGDINSVLALLTTPSN